MGDEASGSLIVVAGLTAVVALSALGVAWTRRAAAKGAGPARDAALLGPDVAPLLAQVAAGDVTGLRQLLLLVREGAWSDRALFVTTLAARAPRKALDAWCQREPDGALPLLVRGAHGIGWAWDGRGAGADAASQALFEHRLRGAERDLHRAAQLDPQDPTPHALLLTIARGLGQPADHAQSLFGAAVRRDPENVAAHLAMLAFVAKTGCGSHEQMFELARATRARVAPWSDLASVVVVAHVEKWLDLRGPSGERAAADAYLASPDTQAEIVDAWEASLGSAALRPRRATALLRNYAAFAFYVVKDRERARRELSHLGLACTDAPWRYLGDPRKAYASAKKWAA
jgi:hypothetical protein